MADIELVIKIPQDAYDLMRKRNDLTIAERVIANGKPLPKGHKRLIEDNFKVGPVFDEEGNRIGYQYVTQEDLNNAQTIIEADKEN